MRYQFNEFILDTDRFELFKNNQHINAEPQVIELLALLVENTHRLVGKEEINDKVWGGRIVSEAALSSRIKTARQLLGDNGRTQHTIRTVHKKGFRFVADVRNANDQQSTEAHTPSKPGANDKECSVENTDSQNDTHKGKPAVAVLPFNNLSSDRGQEYFSDGITTDIITLLSKHHWLNVTARNTTFGFKGQPIDIRELGKQLAVDYVVEGSVQRMGDRIRVSAQLIDANTGLHKWAERYDREMADIFALQDEITEVIVARLEPEIGFSERNKVVHARRANLASWDCFHLGVYHFFKFTGPDNLEAQRLLKQSYALDEECGEAYAWWAYATILGMVYWQTSPSQPLLDEALAACDTALTLDSQNASFYALRARVLLARREYDRAIIDNETAIELNPSFAAAHCGLGDSLAYEARYDESVACFTRAIDLSPNDPQRWAFLSYGAMALLFKKDFEAALQWANRASGIPNCQYWTTAHKVVALAHLKREDEAHQAAIKLRQELPSFTCAFAREKLFYLRKQEQIELYIDGLQKAGIPLGE